MNPVKHLSCLAFCLVLILISSTQKVQASHAMGADLSYVCLGNDSFLITLNFYRDCAGITAPTSASVNLSSASCGISSLSLTLEPEIGTGQEVSPLCPASISNSVCNGGSLPGVQQYVYSGIVQLPAQCSDWVISYSLCCRNDRITTLTTPGSQDIYVEATLNNSGGLCDNSPTFTSLPVPYVCAGQQFNYNHGAVDVDGDSLHYTSINPLDGPGVNIPYTGSFNPNNPMNTTGAFVFDEETGQMTFTPNGGQVAVVTVLVEEFRNGVLIGSTMRDIQVVVIPCSNSQPTVGSGIINNTGGSLVDSFTVRVCPEEALSFQFLATDPDQDMLTITTNVAQAIPDASLSISGSGDTLNGFFSWIPTALDTGVNVFTVTITDGACPIIGTSVYSFQIYVLDGTTAGPDLSYCPAGGPVQLNALGGNNFTWTPASGLSDPNIRNPLASPDSTTTYIVTSDLDTLCKNKDTVTVFVVPDFVLSLSPEDTICRNSSTMLDVVTDNAWAPYTYLWTPNQDISNTRIPNPIVTPDFTTTYTVEVTSDTGCTIRDSVAVRVIGVGPIVEIFPDKNNVCPGDTVQLDGKIFPLECGPTLVGCSAANQPMPRLIGDSTATSAPETPFQGSSEDARYQALYRVADLNAAGMFAGTITRIELDVGTKASSGLYQNFTIKLGCTASDNLNINDGWEPTTIVYGPVTIPTNLGINTFNLNVPYDWDGRNNLVMEICYNNSALNDPGGNDWLMSHTVSYTASMRAYADNTDGCTLQPSFVYGVLPRTTFHICEPLQSNYNITWSPTTGLSDPTILNPTTVVTEEKTYTLFVTDSVCDGSGFVTLNVDTSYSIDASPDTTICNTGDSVQLNVAVLGNPPVSVLSCGINGTQCSNSTHVEQVGTGSSVTTSGTPYEGFWEDGRVQYLFRASELQAAGLTNSGTITELAFDVLTKNSSQPYSNFTIKMGCTNADNLPTSFVSTSLNVVYGPVSYNTFLGWNTHTLASPFDWDGTSNLIVEVCFDNTDWTDEDDVAYTTTPGINSVLYDFTDGASGCSLNMPTPSSNRPNIRFSFCDAPTGTTSIIWTPGNTVTDPSIANPVAFPDTTTTYTVEYTFVNGCTRVDSVTIGVTDFNTSVITSNSFICEGDFALLQATGGNKYEWDSIPGLSCYDCDLPVATPTQTTTYRVLISDTVNGCSRADSVTVNVNKLPFIKFSNDSLLCFIDSVVLDAGDGFTAYAWNTMDSTRTISISAQGTYSVTVTDSNGCSNADSINLLLNPSPVVNLGNDTSTCFGDSVRLTAGPGYAGYQWNTGATDTAITVLTTGTYSVTVADTNNCPGVDSVNVTFQGPPVDLGNDKILCAGRTLKLIAGNSQNTYLWFDGSMDTFFVVSQPGTYSVTATDNIGCQNSDSITIGYYPDNSVDLGNDTVICNNRTMVFNAGAGYASYHWSTGAMSQAISVTQPGIYSVTVVDNNSCIYSDTVMLSDVTPSVNIGNDREICAGESATLSAGPSFETYQWDDPNQTVDSSLTVTAAGTYSVIVTDANGCTATDAANVAVNPLPLPNLGGNDSVCPGYILYPGDFETYVWSDSTTDSILVVNFSGEYSVTVTDANGCSNSDMVDLTVYELNLFLFDEILCSGDDSVVLTGPDNMATYLWSNDSTTQSITVTEEGTYSLTVINNEGCIGTASATITLEPLEVTASHTDLDEQLMTNLNADVGNGSGAYEYQWTSMPPSAEIEPVDAANPSATISENTFFIVEVTDLESGCVGTDTTYVEATSAFAVPSAFTPNGSGEALNETFRVFTTGATTVMELKVYNRWGELVFETTDSQEGWDGTYKGQAQPMGTYVYYVVVQMSDGSIEKESGGFSLLR